MALINLSINGTAQSLELESDTPLLWVLRDHVGLVGTKYGCGIGQCGACTVLVEGEAVRSCAIPVSEMEGKSITTIEGLSKSGNHKLQDAWRIHDVPQCGYCQAGQIMSAASLLKNNAKPTDDEINEAMRGNICRCGTYNRIKAAIKTAAGITE